jgi:hypothetical protein
MAQLAQVAAAVRDYQAGDLAAAAHVQQLLLASADQQSDGQYAATAVARSACTSPAATGPDAKRDIAQHLQLLLLSCADAEFCESLLTCMVESFAAAGDNGKVRQLASKLSF